METTPIENLITPHWGLWKHEILSMIGLQIDLDVGMTLIDFHKLQLGKQNYTFNGEFRFWVWEDLEYGWRVYVSNQKGTCFEVDKNFNLESALKAWYNYKVRMIVGDEIKEEDTRNKRLLR